MVTKKLLQELREKLEKEKESVEKELKSFAKEDINPKGDWDTRYPRFNGGGLEEEADEVQEYEKLLSVEYSLELKLRNINLALEKIKKTAGGESRQGRKKYGKCEKCAKSIDIKRLKACPEARLCAKCNIKKF